MAIPNENAPWDNWVGRKGYVATGKMINFVT